MKAGFQRWLDADTPLRYGDRVTAIACSSGVPFVKQVQHDTQFVTLNLFQGRKSVVFEQF